MTSLTGTGTMVRFILRRDRIRLPVWLVAIIGLVYASAASVQGVYNTPEKMASYAQTIGNSPASVVMSGPPVALDTIGGITIFEVAASAIVATALMAIFLIIRHTRTEEESGRTELLRATVLGRYAPMVAALVVVSAAALVVGLGVAVTFISLDLPVTGSLVYGTAIAAVGIVFTAVGALAAQVTEHARGAIGLGAAVLGASFVLRGAGDVGDGTLSWLSPIGWSQAVHAFDGDRWWPLAISLAFSAVLLAVSLALVEHRDVGAGLVAPRPGPRSASPRLSGAFGLAARLQRGTLIGWASGLFLGGVAMGSVGREVRSLLEENPEIADLMSMPDGADLVDAFFGTAMLLLALVAAGFTVSSALRLRSEETAGHAESLLATGLSRWRWTVSSLAVTTLGTVVVIGAGGLGTGLAHAIAIGDSSQVPRLLGVALAYVPAALVLGGFAVALFGWAPRAALAGWAALVGCVVVGWLGGILDIPEWLADVSPFQHLPNAPLEPITATPLVILSVVAVALAAVGLVGFRRRDVTLP
ncbi:MAG: ABC transporter permease [Nocardioidaceae bacterium]